MLAMNPRKILISLLAQVCNSTVVLHPGIEVNITTKNMKIAGSPSSAMGIWSWLDYCCIST